MSKPEKRPHPEPIRGDVEPVAFPDSTAPQPLETPNTCGPPPSETTEEKTRQKSRALVPSGEPRPDVCNGACLADQSAVGVCTAIWDRSAGRAAAAVGLGPYEQLGSVLARTHGASPPAQRAA
jgi:hypothetical protein